MAVTLRDVALRVGVSPRTVSNVVNGYPYVSHVMRAKVQAALDDLDYRPNLLARSLRRGRTGTVALLVPEIGTPYFAELAHLLVERATALGLTVLIDETTGSRRRELELIDGLSRAGQVDGILLSPLGLDGRALTALNPPLPVVLLGERTAGSRLDHVGFDNVAAARRMVEHLIAEGCRRIAVVAGPIAPSFATSNLRLRGYRAALKAAGLPYDPTLVERTARWHQAEGAAAVHRLLDRAHPPDAVFGFSDTLALGGLRALHERGIAVPGDIRVAGFDDTDQARFNVPALTTIEADKAGIAQCALDLLVARIAGSRETVRHARVEYRLHVRASSSPIGRDGSGGRVRVES